MEHAPSVRHQVAVSAVGWRCVDCRIWFPTWPSDMEPCPGKGKFCPRCRTETVDHPWAEFRPTQPGHEWECGKCAGGDAIFLGGMSVHDN